MIWELVARVEDDSSIGSAFATIVDVAYEAQRMQKQTNGLTIDGKAVDVDFVGCGGEATALAEVTDKLSAVVRGDATERAEMKIDMIGRDSFGRRAAAAGRLWPIGSGRVMR
jgi:hypothetical protein